MSLKKILEQRTIGSAANIPEKVFEKVLIRLKDESPFFKHATFMLSTNRDKITLLSDIDSSNFEATVLDLKELRESMKVTTELYNNNEEVEIYLEEKIYSKIIDAMEKDFAKELANTPGTANKVSGTIGIQMLLEMRKELKTSYLKEAVWIVDRETYNTLVEMEFGDNPLIKSELKNGIVSLTLLGHYLYVVETISEDIKIVFANLKRGFVVRMLNEISVKKLAEIGYTEGAQVYALNTMYCGKVVETAAIVQGAITPSFLNKEPRKNKEKEIENTPVINSLDSEKPNKEETKKITKTKKTTKKKKEEK